MDEKVPPRDPAFLKNFQGPKIFLDGLSGLGARGLRVANEIKKTDKVICNDVNPSAIKFCKLLIAADFSHNFIALGLTSLQITLSVFFISLATLSPLAPSPDKPSRKIFGPWKFFQKAE